MKPYQVKKAPVEGFCAFKLPLLCFLRSIFLVMHFKQLASILHKELGWLLDDCPKNYSELEGLILKESIL